MSAAQTELIVQGRHRDPFSYLGPHKGQIRAWLPQAKDAAVLVDGQVVPMKRAHAAGLFVAKTEATAYRFALRSTRANRRSCEDPYRFPPLLTAFELHLHGEGTNYESYGTLGAHAITCEGVAGVRFAVWAPNAEVVSVTGRPQRLGSHAPSDAFARRGTVGDFFARTRGGRVLQIFRESPSGHEQRSSDPYGFFGGAAQVRVDRLAAYRTTSGATRRGWKIGRRRNWLREPVSMYEVHLDRGCAARNEWLTYRELAEKLLGVRDREWLHAYGVDAHHGAPVFGIVGLSGDRLFRSHVAFRHARRFHGTSSTAAIRRDSASSSIGFRAHFPKDPHGSGLLRRHRALRA